jgi:hypothetical protein
MANAITTQEPEKLIRAYHAALRDENMARARLQSANQNLREARMQSERNDANVAIYSAAIALDKAQVWSAECHRRMVAAGIEDDTD